MRSSYASYSSKYSGLAMFLVDILSLPPLARRYGEVEGVRVIRDRRTGAGKGFAYVLFRERSGVLFACQQSGKLELEGRKLRVFRCKNPNKNKHQSFTGTRALPRAQLKKQSIRRGTKRGQ